MRPVYDQLAAEYKKSKHLGFVITILVPLTVAIVLIVLLPGEMNLEFSGSEPLIISVIVFSIAIGFMARLVLQRMANHLKKMISIERYRTNQLLLSMVVFYLLLCCPALWGAITYILVKNILALLFLLAISATGYFLLTPSLRELFAD